MRIVGRLLALVLGLGALALLAVLIWQPSGDADSVALANERRTRRLSYQANVSLPGAVTSQQTLERRLAAAGFKLGAPIFVRIYKRSFEFEIWMRREGRFERFATYPICYFSGNLGPKLRTGDWQSPEGVYEIEARQLNPHSRWHKAFNLGFPNAYDTSLGRTGSYLMVHGGCSSVGCYAMTNPVVDDIYRLAAAALAAGQVRFQVQALPFRMTPAALAQRASHKYAPFWNELNVVADAFEATRQPPDVVVCEGHYRLNRAKEIKADGVSGAPDRGCVKL